VTIRSLPEFRRFVEAWNPETPRPSELPTRLRVCVVASALLKRPQPGELATALLTGSGGAMLDREKIVAVLRKRFVGAGTDQIAAAANAIVGLEDEWEEVTLSDALSCSDSCYLTRAIQDGTQFKVLQKRPNHIR
jgi:hypothetical protein